MSPSEQKYHCGDCGKELLDKDKPCPDCGSSKKHVHVVISDSLRLREGLKGKVKDKKGKTTLKFISRSKLSNHGKEAREQLRIDIAGDRKFHHVEEQGENGTWSTVHHEDKPLKEKKKK